MTESYSDLQQLLKNQVKTRVFSCFDSTNEKSHEIDKKDVILFYKHYCDTCFGKDFTAWDQLPILSISEKIEKHVPVIGDFVLKYTKEPTDLYGSKCINEIIKIYQETIKSNFEISANETETICVYLKSREWYEDGKTCVKIRFHFPYCRIKKDIINSVINPLVLEYLKSSLETSNYDSHLEGGWESSLKDIGDYITLYGSTDNPTSHICRCIWL